MTCHLFGAKPLPEPMPFSCQLTLKAQISAKFENTKIFIQDNAFENITAKCQPFYPGLNVLKMIRNYNPKMSIHVSLVNTYVVSYWNGCCWFKILESLLQIMLALTIQGRLADTLPDGWHKTASDNNNIWLTWIYKTASEDDNKNCHFLNW